MALPMYPITVLRGVISGARRRWADAPGVALLWFGGRIPAWNHVLHVQPWFYRQPDLAVF